jgi:nucleoside-diphosphate-sugar epimerase
MAAAAHTSAFALLQTCSCGAASPHPPSPLSPSLGIHELLTTNYEGTRQLLQLSRSLPHLASFVHVSSAYTNINRPQGSLVQESIYQLGYGDQPVVASELVQVRLGHRHCRRCCRGRLRQLQFGRVHHLT